MQQITLGQLLESMRLSQHYSKTVLTRGLCSLSSLSRYETDQFFPDIFVLHGLLDRLGIDSDLIDVFVSDKNYILQSYRKEIRKAKYNENWSKVEEILSLYESCGWPRSDNIHQQYILLYKCILAIYRDNDYDTGLALCLEGLDKTSFDFSSLKNLQKLLLTSQEIELLIAYFYIQCKSGNEKDFMLCFKLEEYLSDLGKENFLYSRYLPSVLYNISYYQKGIFDLKQARERIIKAKNILKQNYKCGDILSVLQLQVELDNIMGASTPDELVVAKRMITVAEMLKAREANNLLGQRSIEIWENTGNQTLSITPENR